MSREAALLRLLFTRRGLLRGRRAGSGGSTVAGAALAVRLWFGLAVEHWKWLNGPCPRRCLRARKQCSVLASRRDVWSRLVTVSFLLHSSWSWLRGGLARPLLRRPWPKRRRRGYPYPDCRGRFELCTALEASTPEFSRRPWSRDRTSVLARWASVRPKSSLAISC